VGVAVLCDALEGLHAAHELRDAGGNPVGLVHRDFSPQNILVGTDGRGRLSDFGIAKAEIRAATTQHGFVKGKAAYMSPEQIRGREVDRRSDIWAAGVVAWEVIVGRRLFSVSDVNAMFRIVAEEPQKLRAAKPDVAPEVEAVVARALERNRDDRYATAAQLRQALLDAWEASSRLATPEEVAAAVRAAVAARRQAQAEPPTAGLPDPSTALEPSGAARAAQRRRRLWSAGVAAVLGVAGVALLLARRPAPPPSPPATPPVVAADLPKPAAPAPVPEAKASVEAQGNAPAKSAKVRRKPTAPPSSKAPALTDNPYEKAP
jgi:hypothetical protein